MTVGRKPFVQRPNPAERMAALLVAERMALGRDPTRRDFASAWDQSWATMVRERAWPHATKYRKAWRRAMVATRPACRVAFLAGDVALGDWVEVCVERKRRILVIDRVEVPRP